VLVTAVPPAAAAGQRPEEDGDPHHFPQPDSPLDIQPGDPAVGAAAIDGAAAEAREDVGGRG